MDLPDHPSPEQDTSERALVRVSDAPPSLPRSDERRPIPRIPLGIPFGDALVVGGVIVFVVAYLLPWYSIHTSYGALSAGTTDFHAWNYWSGIIAAVGVIGALILTVVRVLGVRIPLPLADRIHYLFFAGIALAGSGTYLARAFISTSGLARLVDVSAGPAPALYASIVAACLIIGGAVMRREPD